MVIPGGKMLIPITHITSNPVSAEVVRTPIHAEVWGGGQKCSTHLTSVSNSEVATWYGSSPQ